MASIAADKKIVADREQATKTQRDAALAVIAAKQSSDAEAIANYAAAHAALVTGFARGFCGLLNRADRAGGVCSGCLRTGHEHCPLAY